MVAIVIAFPGLVTSSLTKSKVDPSKIEILIPPPEFEREQRARATSPPDFGVPRSRPRSTARSRRRSRIRTQEHGSELEDLFKEPKK